MATVGDSTEIHVRRPLRENVWGFFFFFFYIMIVLCYTSLKLKFWVIRGEEHLNGITLRPHEYAQVD